MHILNDASLYKLISLQGRLHTVVSTCVNGEKMMDIGFCVADIVVYAQKLK